MLYLDHAATSWPKPPGVLAAVAHWFAAVGVSPARGDGARCRLADAATARVRAAVGALCGVARDRVVFTSGATESANLFLRGFLRRGDHVVATAAEHSAVARPLRALADELAVTCEVVAVDGDGYVALADVERALRARPTRLLAVNHASNVTGAVQDAAGLAALAHAHGCALLLDASQTAGLLPLAALGADACIASAHKSLLGPPGLGFLAVREALHLVPAKQGGTGSSVALDRQPTDWPAGFEPGTPNGPAIAGLGAALHWIDRRGSGTLHAHGLAVVDALRASVRDHLGARVRLLGSTVRPRIAILGFTLADLDPAEAGIVLDACGIHARTGYHCAPWIHRWLGTEAGGTIRLSPGPFVSADEALAAVRAFAR